MKRMEKASNKTQKGCLSVFDVKALKKEFSQKFTQGFQKFYYLIQKLFCSEVVDAKTFLEIVILVCRKVIRKDV